MNVGSLVRMCQVTRACFLVRVSVTPRMQRDIKQMQKHDMADDMDNLRENIALKRINDDVQAMRENEEKEVIVQT